MVGVFENEVEGICCGLTNFQSHMIGTSGEDTNNSTNAVDYIKDAKVLRNRLQIELEKSIMLAEYRL